MHVSTIFHVATIIHIKQFYVVYGNFKTKLSDRRLGDSLYMAYGAGALV